jgi:enamine deaminase RidA (YjgF/YER057c/UK114 family)
MSGDTPPTADPVPLGRYRPAVRHADTIYTAGMTPRLNGELQFTGPVRSTDPVEYWREAVVLACRNALAAARGQLGPGERIAMMLSLTVFIAAEQGFTLHSKLADFASAFLFDELGDAGIGSRVAVGVTTLPGDAPVEIQIVAVAAR